METLDLAWFNHRDPWHPQAGGAEAHLREVGRRLAARGHRITVFTERYPGSAKVEYRLGMNFVRFNGGRLVLHVRAPLELISKRNRWDAVIDDIAHAVPWFSPIFAKDRTVAIVYHVHGRLLRTELDPVRATAVQIAERTIPYVYSRIITISKTTKSNLVKLGCEPSSISVVYLGVDTNLFRPGEKAPHPLVICLSRMKRYKGIPRLLSAWRLVEETQPDASLIVIGDGDARRPMELYARQLGLRRISFVGHVSEQEKVKLLQSAWVHVAPSEREGWGLAVIEVGACGTPSIGFAGSGLEEALSFVPGSVVIEQPGDAYLAQAISNLLGNGGGRPIDTKWVVRFDWQKTTAETERLLLPR